MTRKFLAVILAVIAALALCGQAMAAQSVSGTKNADIVFFIDSSGSMQNDIDGVRTNLAAFSRSMRSSDVDARFAIVEYQTNRGIVTHKPNGTDTWTSDTSLVESVLGTISADDGDGYTLDAISEIFSWEDFRSDASRFGFLLTDVMRLSNDTSYDVWINDYDADSADISEINTLMEDTVQRLRSTGMNMSVISTSGLRSAYQNLYSQTGGAFIDITTSDYYKSMLDMSQWISEEVSTENPLPHALVQAVPDEILHYVSGDETVLERIARLANISVDQINVITTQSLDLRLPHEPTEAMRQKADGEFIAKLDTLVLSFDTIPKGESGYFLFQLELPDEVLSMDLKVSDLKIWYATPNEFSSSGVTETFQAAFDPFSYMEITDVLGFKADTLAKKVLVLVFCNAGESLSMWLLKHALMILLGGCSSFTLAHSGVTVLLAVGGAAVLSKVFRKR